MNLDTIFAICEDCVKVMHIISRLKLTNFASLHRDAKAPLDAWFKNASRSNWHSLSQIKTVYPHADLVGRLVVFNIGGNKYRLVCKVSYARPGNGGTIYIRGVYTHAEYDKGDWKNDAWF